MDKLLQEFQGGGWSPEYRDYEFARRRFWKIHDELVHQGFGRDLGTLTSHPRYLQADRICRLAYGRLTAANAATGEQE